MKYLIQNRKEFAISVGFFVMTAINLVKAIRSKDMTEDLVVAVVYGALGVLAWFYNMPTSEENCIATGQMRLMKEQNKGRTDGEFFLEEPEDEEDDEEEDEDEL